MHLPVWGQHDSVLTTHLVLLAYFQANLASELHLHESVFRSDLSWSVISCSLMECPCQVVLKAAWKDSSKRKSPIRSGYVQLFYNLALALVAIGCAAFSPEIAFVSKDLLSAFHKQGL